MCVCVCVCVCLCIIFIYCSTIYVVITSRLLPLSSFLLTPTACAHTVAVEYADCLSAEG